MGKFEEKDFQVLRQLLKVVEDGGDAKTLAVACHDLGCFIQHFPAGKGIVCGARRGPPAPVLQCCSPASIETAAATAPMTSGAARCLHRAAMSARDGCLSRGVRS